jgi:TP901 family phage tail tape measure protein
MAAKFVLTAQLQLQAPNNVGQVLNQIQSQLKGGVTVNVQANGATSATQQINKLTNATKQAGNAAFRMGQQFGVSLNRFAGFAVATRAVSLFTNNLAKSIQEAIDFQNEVVKLSQVTGKTTEELRGLTQEVTRLSVNLGTSSKDLLDATQILAQAGIQAGDLKIALDALAKTTLAPTFNDVRETAEGVVAIMAQFGTSAKDLKTQLGAINTVSAEFAVESEDIISAIRRTGGVFKQSGGSLEEFIALFTSVRATTRESAESIATGLRTIFTRIQRPATIEYLKQFGVELTDINGKFVGPYEAVKQLSEALSHLGEGNIQFVKIAEELGGFRQIGKVIPLLQQFELAERARQAAIRGGTSLDKDAATAQQSLAVQIQKVKEEFAALIRGVADTATFQLFVKTTLNLASALIKVADSLKPLIPLITAFAAVKITQNIGSFAAGIGAGLNKKSQGGVIHAFARGGVVPGTGNGDTVPAMLTPGEFVIKKSSVNKIGADTLAAMNENRYAEGGKIRAGIIALRPYDKDPVDTPKIKSGDVTLNMVASKAGFGATEGTKFAANAKSIQTASRPFSAEFQQLLNNKKIPVESVGIGIGDQTVGESTEREIRTKFLQTVNSSGEELRKYFSKLGGTEVANSQLSDSDLDKFGVESIIGNMFESLLARFGAPFNDGQSDSSRKAKVKGNNNSAFDFPGGIGALAKGVFAQFVNIPVDAKRTLSDDYVNEVITKKYPNLLAEEYKQFKKLKGQEILENQKDKIQEIYKNSKQVDVADSNVADLTGLSKTYIKEQRKSGTIGGAPKAKASGGGISGTDTVPAMLTPGEFVINKQAAQRIGYGNLNRMNSKGVVGYAKGGAVQHFADGGTAKIDAAAVFSTLGGAAVALQAVVDPATQLGKQLKFVSSLTLGLGTNLFLLKSATEISEKRIQGWNSKLEESINKTQEEVNIKKQELEKLKKLNAEKKSDENTELNRQVASKTKGLQSSENKLSTLKFAQSGVKFIQDINKVASYVNTGIVALSTIVSSIASYYKEEASAQKEAALATRDYAKAMQQSEKETKAAFFSFSASMVTTGASLGSSLLGPIGGLIGALVGAAYTLYNFDKQLKESTKSQANAVLDAEANFRKNLGSDLSSGKGVFKDVQDQQRTSKYVEEFRKQMVAANQSLGELKELDPAAYKKQREILIQSELELATTVGSRAKSEDEYKTELNKLAGKSQSTAAELEKLAKSSFAVAQAQRELTKANIDALTLSSAFTNAAASVDNMISIFDAGTSDLERSLNLIKTSQSTIGLDVTQQTQQARQAVTSQLGGNAAAQEAANRAFDRLQESNKVRQNIAGLKNLDLSVDKAAARGQIQTALQRGINSQEGRAAIEKSLNDLGENTTDLSKVMEVLQNNLKEFDKGALEATQALVDQEKKIRELTKNRIQTENEYINVRKQAIDVELEAANIIEEFGGAKVTSAQRIGSLNQKLNLDLVRTGQGIRTGSTTEISAAQRNLARASLSAPAVGTLSQDQIKKQEDINNSQKQILEYSKSRVDLIRKEIEIAKKKNQLEQDSLEKLISGDIEGFLKDQAGVAAKAAVESGSTSLVRQFGVGALGTAYKSAKESGVQGAELEKFANAALGSAGITDQRSAQVLAGTTEQGLMTEAQQFAGIMKDAANSITDIASKDIMIAQAQIDITQATYNQMAQARARGGLIYANRGIFVPRGTDTVPAMLTPGEFVVNRNAVNRGNNLQVLQAMNSGGANQAATMSNGGKVSYYNQGGVANSMSGLGSIGAAFDVFSSAVDRLLGFNFTVKLDPVNVNVTLNGSMLSKLSDEAKNEVLKAVVNEIQVKHINDGTHEISRKLI